MELTCDSCRLRPWCSRAGASPLLADGVYHKCEIYGGYPKHPVPKHKVSEESVSDYKDKGPYLSIVSVPSYEDGTLTFDLIKLWSPKILDHKPGPSMSIDFLYPKSHS